MKNLALLAIGMLMISVTLLLASGTSTQDVAARPQIALEFATRLHQTPIDTPESTNTPTITKTPLPSPNPVATVTPVPNGVKYPTGTLEMWLPSGYAVDGTFPVHINFSRADLVGELPLEGFNISVGMSSYRSMEIFQVKTFLPPDQTPYGIEAANQAVEISVPVSAGRYSVYRSLADKTSSVDTHYTQLWYWIPHGKFGCLVIFTTHIESMPQDRPIFEQIIRSLTVLQGN